MARIQARLRQLADALPETEGTQVVTQLHDPSRGSLEARPAVGHLKNRNMMFPNFCTRDTASRHVRFLRARGRLLGQTNAAGVAFKTQGNDAFRTGEPTTALALYTQKCN